MNYYEKREIAGLPPKYRPISAWGYIGYIILFLIPLIGFICLIAFSLSDSNINRRSFARCYFCIFILVLIMIAAMIAVLIITGAFDMIYDQLQDIILEMM